MAIKLIIDSSSDIGQTEAENMGITMLPMEITFGTETFFDGVNLAPRDFYEKLVETDELPKTSQITEYRFEEAFEKVINEGDRAICITLSSKLSSTFSNCEKAAKKFPGKAFAVDSLNAAIGERILIQYAMRLISENLPAEEIVEKLNAKKQQIKIMALIDTLKYLKKGGRISAMTAFAGELLGIKPVIAVVKGEVKLVGKAMGSKKGNNLLVQMINNEGKIDFSMPYAVAYSGLTDEYLKKYLKDSEALWKDGTDEVPSYIVGSTIGTHVGPGAVAVAYFNTK